MGEQAEGETWLRMGNGERQVQDEEESGENTDTRFMMGVRVRPEPATARLQICSHRRSQLVPALRIIHLARGACL